MIVIPSHISRVDNWLKDCLGSVKDEEYIVVFQGEKPDKDYPFPHTYQELNGFDPGGIVWAREHLTKDFFLLHDSCVVKDNKLFDVCFRGYSGNSVALADHPTMFGMFLGKYLIDIVKQMEPPIAKDKAHAVDLEETWNKEYCGLDYPIGLNPLLKDTEVFEDKYGRKNMILENKWIKKYKGAWNRNML